jgi:nucleotide-binding universal stress UspA family protein
MYKVRRSVMKILSVYDGTIHAKNALQYGIDKIREKGGEVLLLQIFDSSIFVDYDAGPKAEEMARAEAAQQLEAARQIIQDTAAGISVRVVSEEGDPEQTVLRYAEAEHPELVLAPPRYKALVRTALCPVYSIPGAILVPVDDTDIQFANMDSIREEAAATGSKVILLGIVPVHLYSKEEKKELEKVSKKTDARLNRINKMLAEAGIETKKIMRSGYPDEEIMKAADEFSVSLVILPSGGSTPSELRKAAAVILNEPNRPKSPFLLVPATKTA